MTNDDANDDEKQGWRKGRYYADLEGTTVEIRDSFNDDSYLVVCLGGDVQALRELLDDIEGSTAPTADATEQNKAVFYLGYALGLLLRLRSNLDWLTDVDEHQNDRAEEAKAAADELRALLVRTAEALGCDGDPAR